MNPLLRRSAAHAFVEALDSPELTDEDRHHLAKVLRLREGEAVSVSDGAGAWRMCVFGSDAALHPESAILTEPRPQPQLTIGFALPKRDRPEWIVQKLTEIGADRIVVLHTDRSVTTWGAERAERHLDKLRRTVREAAMQSRRVWLPAVDGPLMVADLGGDVAVAEPGGQPVAASDTTVLIGPEGGWTDTELAATPRHVALGSSILRVETAALVAASRMVALRDNGAETGHTG